ncbi:acyl carrier protein [Kutzneria sp. NPDC052558]|uniref:acyl carrier protein n=1 Tax=Kutzneria sp. NPDC052558 TaxID=3364121 RepID=UPI0037C50972
MTVLDELSAIVGRVLADGQPHAVFDVDDDLREVLGFDSLAVMHVLSSAEERFDVLLDDDEAIASTTSVRSLASCISSRMSG